MNVETQHPTVLQTFRDEFVALIRWTLGLAVIVVVGWLFWAVGWYVAQHFGIDPRIGLGVCAAISLAAFVWLEQEFWISHLMGLHVGPHSQPWASALFLWAFGVAGILLRSSGPPSVATAAAPVTSNGRKTQGETAAEEPGTKDSFREIVETVVFVVVLVLLLKTFIAEAFVIPTGSMAETLLGYQRFVTCAKCGQYFPVNCSSEVDPQAGPPVPVMGCTCPNCRYREVWREFQPNGEIKQIKEPPSWSSGDRVLVSKFPYDAEHLGMPNRFNVVVFKYPRDPQQSTVPMNYIKRLVGLPGETVAIFNGDVYVHKSLEFRGANHLRPADPKETWKEGFTFLNDDAAIQAFKDRERVQGGFEILRKPPATMLEMRRIVYDNDHQASDLADKRAIRWKPAERASWVPESAERPLSYRYAGEAEEKDQWLRYRHLLIDRISTNTNPPNVDVPPSLIRNFMGYNTGGTMSRGDTNWVSDLMLECTIDVDRSLGEFVIELCKSADKVQARFDLRSGAVTLLRAADQKVFATSPNGPSRPGSYRLRFADFDDRLTLWIDDQLAFGAGVDVPPTPPLQENPNNLDPAGVAVRGAAKLTVSHLKLWRDTFYTQNPEGSVVDGVQTRYVHPGHYMCLGDNSSESSDSRYWGLVPERLMLGRALLVYYPFTRAGRIR